MVLKISAFSHASYMIHLSILCIPSWRSIRRILPIPTARGMQELLLRKRGLGLGIGDSGTEDAGPFDMPDAPVVILSIPNPTYVS